jgi:hypothetical protein
MSSESLFLGADVTELDGVQFVLIVPRSCATSTGFRLVSLLVAFGGLASSGLCSVCRCFSLFQLVCVPAWLLPPLMYSESDGVHN